MDRYAPQQFTVTTEEDGTVAIDVDVPDEQAFQENIFALATLRLPRGVWAESQSIPADNAPYRYRRRFCFRELHAAFVSSGDGKLQEIRF